MFGVDGEAITTGEAEADAGTRLHARPTAVEKHSTRPATAIVRRFARFSGSMDDLSPNTM
jgi:hypothetical protein